MTPFCFNIIISNPADLAKLQKKGLKLDPPDTSTPEERLSKLFESRKKSALGVIDSIPNLPDVPIPIIGFLYDEIRMCALFGLNGAAISLSAVLVEYVLKQAIVRKKYANDYNADEWNRIEEIEFQQAINEARKLGLLNDDSKKQFIDFKNEVRNPYLHYNIKKITKGVKVDKVGKLDIETQKVEEVELDTENDPILWPYAKRFVDKERLKSVLDFACYAVGLLLACDKNGVRSIF